MKKTLPIIIVLIVIAIVFIAIGISNKGKIADKGEEKAQYRIAVIPKGTTHSFWKSIRAGAEKAGAEVGAKIFWNGPERESNRQRQIEIVEDFIVQKISGIVLAPVDSKALVPVV